MSSVFYKLLDIGFLIWYDAGMDEITIVQAQDVLGWSYPTALAFAKATGRLDLAERRWYIPAPIVWSELQKRRAKVEKAESQLKHYCLNYHPSYSYNAPTGTTASPPAPADSAPALPPPVS